MWKGGDVNMEGLYYSDDFVQIYNGHAVEILKNMADESVQCVVTSPPY